MSAHKPQAVLRLGALPPALRPLVRAWVLGSLWAVGPQVLSLALRRAVAVAARGEPGDTGRDDGDVEGTRTPSAKGDDGGFWEELVAVVRGGCVSSRFPIFCAVLVGGSSLLEALMTRLIADVWKTRDTRNHVRLARWTTAFVAAWASLRLLQTKKTRQTSASPEPPLAGSTLDLTLFAFVRAVDVVAGELWSQYQRREGSKRTHSTTNLLPNITTPLVFSASSALIMWSFIYHPDRLPRAYNRWISSAAAVNPRLVEVLRRCRRGEWVYGADTGQAPLLAPLCAEYGHPARWADPATVVPLPCELVHTGHGPSCERHALVRFGRSFSFALATYLPLSLVALLARRVFNGGSRVSAAGVARAFRSASRSSLFLASFIALFWYGVCLGRTRLGPRVLGTSLAARQRIDEGLCIGAACALCGWSVLIESAGRQKDMALFVAPRALATLVPRRYPASKEWRETVVFAASAAVVLTCAKEDPGRISGVLGLVLRKLLKE